VQDFCFAMMIKSWRIFSQTWVNEAFCTLAENLPSNAKTPGEVRLWGSRKTQGFY